MTTTKKELSYFRLKLEAYLGEHFPERVNENTFITARADEALTTYCDAIAQGFFSSRGGDDGKRSSYIKVCTFPSMTRLCLS